MKVVKKLIVSFAVGTLLGLFCRVLELPVIFGLLSCFCFGFFVMPALFNEKK